MEHYYFFVIDSKSKEPVVFYKNYDFLVVPVDCFLINVEMFDEKQIIEMMLNGNEISDKRKEQFRRILKEAPERFNLDRNFPVYAGAGHICRTIAEISNNSERFDKQKYYEKANEVLNWFYNNEIDLWGNVCVYERVNGHIGTEEFPPVLTREERKLFARLLVLKYRGLIPEIEFKRSINSESHNTVNLRQVDLFLERQEPRVIEKQEIFKAIIRKVLKNNEFIDKFILYMKQRVGKIYRGKSMREYCTSEDKYFLGSLAFLKNSGVHRNFETFLKMVSLPTYEESIKLGSKVVVLGRQETILLSALCKEVEDHIIVIPKNRLVLFEREMTEFLIQNQAAIIT